MLLWWVLELLYLHYDHCKKIIDLSGLVAIVGGCDDVVALCSVTRCCSVTPYHVRYKFRTNLFASLTSWGSAG